MAPTTGIIISIFSLIYVYKKAYINIVILNKLLKNKFRVNKLIKYPLKDGALLQLQLTLFKEFLLSLPKISINVGSNLI